MAGKHSIRALFAVLLVLSSVTVGYGAAEAQARGNLESHLARNGVDENARVAPPNDGITVVATDSNAWLSEKSDGPRAVAELVAFNPDGTVLYYDDTHSRYWDVDPVPGSPKTVEYAYADHLSKSECPTEWHPERYGVSQERWDRYYSVHGKVPACTRNGVERVNLETGEVTKVWSHITPGKEATRYHDVDRLGENRLVVADIYLDRVFVVNTATDRIEWSWDATSVYPTDTGGPHPKDWTHINDVEVLPDGRIMVSVRNHDQVVFLDRDGAVEGWTLGAEDAHDTLYEQHNPDYIPPENGGPAVVVADSENNRVVEYQRQNGEWTRTWTWQDARMQWPRDADRLPNGHTLVTDSNGNRVFEVDRQGDVVWSVDVAFPYEAERLGTGDESADGPSALHADLDSRSGAGIDWLWIGAKQVLPAKYLSSLMYATPIWVGVQEVLALVLGGIVLVAWTGLELRWALSRRSPPRPSPLRK